MYSSLFYLNAVLCEDHYLDFEKKLQGVEEPIISSDSLQDSIFKDDYYLTKSEAMLIGSNEFHISQLCEVIRTIGNEFLEYENNCFFVRQGNVVRWRKYNLDNGEDLFCCALLADRVKNDVPPFQPDLDWPFCLRVNNSRLDDILSNGFSENHLHLNGSAPIFYLNWASMNQSETIDDIATKRRIQEAHNLIKDKADEFFLWCKRAYVLRRFLFFALKGTTGAEIHQAETEAEEKSKTITTAYLGISFN